MTAPVPPEMEFSRASQAVRLDPVCDEFERQWQLGHRPRLEDYLARAAEADRRRLFPLLVGLDLHYRKHEDPCLEEYLQRFPAYTDLLDPYFAPPHLAQSDSLGSQSTIIEAWHMARDGATLGPYSRDQLREMFLTRRLALDDKVWRPGLHGWVDAAEVPGLCEPSAASSNATLHEATREPPTITYVRPSPGAPVTHPKVPDTRARRWALAIALSGLLIAAGAFGWELFHGRAERNRRQQAIDEVGQAKQREEEATRLVAVQRRSLYAAHMNLAFEELEKGNILRVRDLLGLHAEAIGQEDLRGFEWYYLWQSCREDRVTLEGSDPMLAVAWSPDGRLVATGEGKLGGPDQSRSGMLRVWDATTGKDLVARDGQRGGVTAVAFSPDGRFLASGCRDGSVRLWAIGEWESVAIRDEGPPVEALAFSRRGDLLAISDEEGGVAVWHLLRSQPVAELAVPSRPQGTRTVLAFSPDGKSLAFAGGTKVVLWTVATGKTAIELSVGNAGVRQLAFSPDGRFLAAVSATPPTGTGAGRPKLGFVQLWRVEDGKPVEHLKVASHTVVHGLAFSPNSQLLATGGEDRLITVLDVKTGRVELTLRGHEEAVTGLAFNPRGHELASASRDGTIKLWDLARGPGDFLSAARTESVSSLAFLDEGRSLVTAGRAKGVRLWDWQTRLPTTELEKGDSVGSPVVAVDPQGKWIAIGLDGRAESDVILLDAKTRSEVARLRGHQTGVNSAAFSPDGLRLATADRDGVLRVWDTDRRQQVGSTATGPGEVAALSFAPDGRSVAVGTGSRVEMRRIDDLSIARSLNHGSTVKGLAIAPDGKWLVSGGEDGTVKLWDLSEERERVVVRTHTQSVSDVAFSPDGRTLTVSGDEFVVFLDPLTGERRGQLRHAAEGASFPLAFTADGRTLACGGLGVRRWRAARDEDLARDRVRKAELSPGDPPRQ